MIEEYGHFAIQVLMHEEEPALCDAVPTCNGISIIAVCKNAPWTLHDFVPEV